MDLSWSQIPFPILLLDAEGVVVAANARAAGELGTVLEELIGVSGDEALRITAPRTLDGREVCLGPRGLAVRLHCRSMRWRGKDCEALTWFSSVPFHGHTASVDSEGREEGDGPLILVADDEESIRDICRRALGEAGYRVILAEDGQVAIDILDRRGSEVSLILTDVVMPEAGGEAILDYMRRVNLDTPIVYATGHSRHGSAVDFLDGKGVTILRKPYTLAQLLSAVKERLALESHGGNPP